MSAVKVNLIRRRLLIGGAVAGVGAVAVAAIRDGELGAPPQTFRGAVPWAEGTADAPPGASGSGYVFFSPAEAAFIEAAVGRLIPHDEVGPGGVEASVPFFWIGSLPGNSARATTTSSAVRGARGHRNKAIKAASARRSFTARQLRRLTSTCARISRAVYSLP